MQPVTVPTNLVPRTFSLGKGPGNEVESLQFGMFNYHYKTRLLGIVVVVFIKTNIQSKMMNTSTIHDSLHVHLIEETGHVQRSIHQYPSITWLQGFQVKIVLSNFFKFLSLPKRDFDTKKTTYRIFSRKLLNYLIERGLFAIGLVFGASKEGFKRPQIRNL